MLSTAEIAWRNRVTNLLGPPIEIDFEKETARRAARKPSVPAVDHSSGRRRAQKRPLRGHLQHVNAKTGDDSVRRVDSSLSSLQRPKHPYSTSATKQVQPEMAEERSVKRKDLASTSTSRGWISRSTFYDDDDNARKMKAKGVGETMSSEKRSDAAFNHNAVATGTEESVERTKQLSPHNVWTEKVTRNHFTARLNSPGMDGNKCAWVDHRLDSPAWESSSLVKPSQKRKRASLFRPIAKRTNQKMKQTSLHMFAKVFGDFN